jgi:hypothetical protein
MCDMVLAWRGVWSEWYLCSNDDRDQSFGASVLLLIMKLIEHNMIGESRVFVPFFAARTRSEEDPKRCWPRMCLSFKLEGIMLRSISLGGVPPWTSERVQGVNEALIY